jgi:FXSXX-COOH protein
MHTWPGDDPAEVPDLTDLPLERILEGPDSALSQAVRRVLGHIAEEEAPVAAYDSGGDSSGRIDAVAAS